MLKFFDRYVLREITPPFLVGLLITTFVLLMNQILLFTEIFITRGVSFRDLVLILLYIVPSILVLTIPMAVLMGILGGLGRFSSDSEIMAFKTLGISTLRLLRPVLVFSFLGWALTAYLALYLGPRSNYRLVQTLTQSVLSKVQFKIHPREFNESIPNTVIFMKGMTPDRNWESVFIHSSDKPEEPRAIFARQGKLVFYPEMKRAVLELFNGVVHSYSLAEPEKYGMTSFEHFEEEINVENFFASFSEKKRVREKDVEELMRDLKVIKADMAELAGEKEKSAESASRYFQRWKEFLSYSVEVQKKVALPFACLIFGFLALPLGSSTKKGGRTSGYTISLGIILAYYILITAGEKTALDGKLSPFAGIWAPNIFFFLIGCYLLAASIRESRLFPGLSRFWLKKAIQDRLPKRKAFSRNWPRFSLPFPNILDRYIIRKYLAIFSLIFFGLLLVFAIVTFFERIDNIYEHKKSIMLLLEFIRYSTPDFIRYILPASALTTALLSLGLLTKFNEVTAMKACGVSVYRLILPVVVLAVIGSFFSFYIQENIVPYSNKKAEETWHKITDVPPRSYSYLDRRWVLGKDRSRIFHYNYFDPQKSVFSELSIYDFDSSSWSLQRRIYAEKARLGEGLLMLADCWLREFSGGAPAKYEKKEKMNIDLVEGRDYFLKEYKEPDQMSYGELRQYVKELEERDFNTVRFKVDLQSKMSFPLACLVMTLLGIPFAFSMGRRGALVGIGLSIAISMVYWGAIGIFEGFGYLNYLNAFLAAWGPNLIFGLGGLYLLFTLRT